MGINEDKNLGTLGTSSNSDKDICRSLDKLKEEKLAKSCSKKCQAIMTLMIGHQIKCIDKIVLNFI